MIADASLLQIVILAVVQGLAELLPVSSSAHVIVAAKLMKLDPTTPEMTLLVVMLHAGTMLAVILYFWPAWKSSLFASRAVFRQQAVRLALATTATVAVGGPLILGIEKGAERAGYLVADAQGRRPKVEIEMLFGNLGLVAAGLAAAGALTLIAGLAERRAARNGAVGVREALWIGAVQGLCLPFRGFSRSGATISTGLLLGVLKARAEEFSFALAVIITPPVIGHEVWRLVQARREAGDWQLRWSLFGPGLLGMVCAFLAGLLALKWLSRWLEGGRWYLFGVYCLAAASVVFALYCYGR
jgi:undecaprenyl-diphosphatase